MEEVELTEQEKQAEELCQATDTALQKAESENQLTPEILLSSLEKFKECLTLDPDCTEARFGIAYVCGHLDKFEEGLNELDILEAMGIKDDRIESMRENLMNMQLSAEESAEDEEDEPAAAHGLVTIEYLIKEGEITADFKTVLTDIFHRFDKDKDGALSAKELDAFHRVVNGTPIAQPTLSFLLQNFEVDKKGTGLTLNGFIGFYTTQTTGDSEETIRDLRQLGYNRDLSKI